MKKLSKLLIFAFLCTVLFIGKAYAILPALIFTESVIESFAIRSAANQVLTMVGTAANDASWSSSFLNWMNAGRGVTSLVLLSSGTTYEVAVTGSGADDLTHAAPSPNLVWQATMSISASASADHVAHTPNLPFVASPDQAVADWVTWATPYYPNEIMIPLFPCFDEGYVIQLTCPMTAYASNLYTFWNSDPAHANSTQYLAPALAVYGQEIESTDGIKRIIGTPGHWSADTTDPDWTPAEKTQLVNSPTLRFTGVTSSYSVLDLSGDSNGLKLEYQQLVAGDVRQLIMNTDALSVPMSVSSSQSTGVITDPGTVPSGNPSGSPTNSPVVFPNDYARQGEASTAAGTITPKLDTLHRDLTDTAPLSDPTVPVSGDMPTWGETFTNLLSWHLPAHSSVCPQPTINLTAQGLGSHTLNSHCALLTDHAAALHSAMVAVFTVLALFIVLGA